MITLAIAVGAMLSRGDDAKFIFTEFERQLHVRKSASGDLEGRGQGSELYSSSFLLQKPRSFRVIDGQIDLYCNGETEFSHLISEKEYLKRDVSRHRGYGAPSALDAFFGLPTGESAPYFVKKTEYQMQVVDGHLCAAKAIHFESFGRDDRMVFFVDRASKQIRGWDQVFGYKKMFFRIKNLRFDFVVPADAFDWKLTPGLKERVIRPK
ncbi:MAG: hypothetical protein P4L46_22535 [Fimbriimonas sp.]|nr:hypothetical protein [Fimbriimonas sp.]